MSDTFAGGIIGTWATMPALLYIGSLIMEMRFVRVRGVPGKRGCVAIAFYVLREKRLFALGILGGVAGNHFLEDRYVYEGE